MTPELLGSTDPTTIYMEELANIPDQSNQEKRDLSRIIQQGERAKEILEQSLELSPNEIIPLQEMIEVGNNAANEMIEKNLRLVIPLAKKYKGLGLSFDDLIQAGNEGLMQAVYLYDPDYEYEPGKTTTFSTYAYYWIRQAVSREVKNNSKTIRVPVHTQEQIYRLRKVEEQVNQYIDENDPSFIGELATKLDTTENNIRFLKAIEEPISLDEPQLGTPNEDSDLELVDIIKDKYAIDPEDKLLQEVLERDVASILEELDTRQQIVISLRYKVGDYGEYVKSLLNPQQTEKFKTSQGLSLEDVGDVLDNLAKNPNKKPVYGGVTKERVRQIEGRALSRLKYLLLQLRSKENRPY